MPNDEVEFFISFIARELIDMVRKRCQNSMVDPNDKNELEGIIKDFLDSQNLKKRLWAAAKLELRK